MCPCSPHSRAAEGAIIGALRTGSEVKPSLLLDGWNHPPTKSAAWLGACVNKSHTRIIMCMGLSGSGKTAAAYSLVRKKPVIVLTLSTLSDTADSCPANPTAE